MKKIVLILFFFLLFGSITQSFADGPDFLVKKAQLDDNTFATSINDVTVDSQITFQVTAFADSGNRQLIISLPTGYEYVSHQLGGDCPVQNLNGATNSSFNYSFDNDISPFCVSDIKATYKVVGSVANGNNTIQLREGVSNVASVSIGVTNNITITQAQSIDRNNNGFIDGYNLTFSRNITDSSVNLSNIKVGGETVTGFDTLTTANDTSAQIQFADNFFHTGETPQILDSIGGFLTDVAIINNASITEQDKASGVFTKFNGVSIPGGSISIGTGSFTFELNETPIGTSINHMSVVKNSITATGSFSLSGKVVTFTPNPELEAGEYSLVFGTGVTDLSNNGFPTLGKTLSLVVNRVMACTGLPANAQWNSVSSITQSWNGITGTPTLAAIYNTTASTTECRYICNSSSQWNGSSCEPKPSSGGGSSGGGGSTGGGGGGGSSVPTCTDAELVCKNGIFYIKPGNICTGGNFAKACLSQEQIWGKDFIEFKNETASGTQNITLDIVENFAQKEFSKKTQTELQKFQTYFDIQEVSYFLAKNQLFQYQYQTALAAYKTYGEKYELALKDGSQVNKVALTKAKTDLENALKELKNPTEKYVGVKKLPSGIEVSVTTDKKIVKAAEKIETVILNKFNRLKTAKVISQDQYETGVQSYNNFILYLTIYRSNKDKTALKNLEASLNGINALYKKKIPKKVTPAPVVTPKKLIGEVFPLGKEQRLKAYNDEVKNLQLILKHFGYFSYEATGYFGQTTSDMLKKFSQEKLNITYPGYLSTEMITKIKSLEY